MGPHNVSNFQFKGYLVIFYFSVKSRGILDQLIDRSSQKVLYVIDISHESICHVTNK